MSIVLEFIRVMMYFGIIVSCLYHLKFKTASNYKSLIWANLIASLGTTITIILSRSAGLTKEQSANFIMTPVSILWFALNYFSLFVK